MVPNVVSAVRAPLAVLAAVFILPISAKADVRPVGQLSGVEATLSDLVLRLSRSIVSVEVITSSAGGALTGSDALASRLVASGVVADSAGGILIAASTVRPDAVYLVNFEGKTERARLVGVDYVNDLALLSCGSPLGLPVTFAYTQVCAGQMVVSISNAFGIRASPSLGFCAGTRPDGNLQFSMLMSSSSQGGGVFDFSGRLLGILNGTIGREQGMAVAAPAAKLDGLSQLLRRQGDRKAGYLGLTSIDDIMLVDAPGSQILPAAAPANHASRQSARRAILVTAVQPGSPAALAGIFPGDILTALNESPLESSSDLALKIRQSRPGTPVSLTVNRPTGERRLFATIGCRSALPPVEPAAPQESDSLRQTLRQLQLDLQRIQRQLDSRP